MPENSSCPERHRYGTARTAMTPNRRYAVSAPTLWPLDMR